MIRTTLKQILLSWWTRHIGKSSATTPVLPTVPIPSPWSPMSRSGTTVNLSGNRTYSFATPFGTSFTMGTQEILSAPATLKLQSSTGGGLQTVTATPTLYSEQDGQIKYNWAWTGTNNIGAHGTITIEADGCIRQQFTLTRVNSQQFSKITLTIPLTPALCQFLKKYPRINYSHPTQDLSGGTWEWTFGATYEAAARFSFEFPRVLQIHDSNYGLEWAMESDEFWAGNAGAADSSITLDTTTGLFVLNICNGAWPFSASDYDLTYDFFFTPLPTKSQNENLIRVGDCGDTPAVTEFRPITEECDSSPWKYQGSLVPRTGPYVYLSAVPAVANTFANHRANLLARGLKTAGYTSWGIWPNADPAWVEAWRLNDGFTQTVYKVDCDGVTQYQIRGVDPSILAFRTMGLARWAAAIHGGAQVCDWLYFDVTNLSHASTTYTDVTGRARYRYFIRYPRELARDCQVICQTYGAKVISHAQCDWVACIHSFFDYNTPGENHDHWISLESDGNVRRRYFLGTFPQVNWRTELPTKVLGLPSMFIPRISPTDTGAGEDFATEVCIAATCIHNVGYWKSFGSTTPALRYFTAIRNFDMTDATFYGYWETYPPVATADASAYVSSWVKGSSLMIAVVNMLDTDRNIVITTVDDTDTPLIRYSGYGLSVLESRTTPYTAAVTTSDTNEYTVGVGRYNLTLLEVAITPTPPDPVVPGNPTTSFGRPRGLPEVYQRKGN